METRPGVRRLEVVAGNQLHGPLHALGCTGSAEGEGPNRRCGSRIGGDGEDLLSTQALHVEDKSCEFVGESKMANDDRSRKVGSGGDMVMEKGCRLPKFCGRAERVQGVNGIDVGLNDEPCNDDDSEHSGGAQKIDITGRGIETSCHRIVQEINERDGYGDDEGSIEGKTCANDNDASDDESLRLNEQLLENKRTWELAKESGAVLYNEEDDIIAILQQQNEKITRKRRFAKQKAKVRRSRPKTQKKRGLRGDGKIRMVKDLKRKFRLNMLGLVETKRQPVTSFDVKKIWGNGCVGWDYVESTGASGGLLLMWDEGSFEIRNCYKSERWLCVAGVLLQNNFNCAFILVYGAHVRDEKLVVWEELSYIAGLCQVPCCFMGDFNEIVQVEERRGTDSLSLSVEDFKNWIHDMGLMDLPITDRKFTWFRGRSCSRIDKALVSLEWLEEFPETRLRDGPRGLSDHCPIMVEDKRLRDGPRPFRILDSWFTYKGFLRLVNEEWRGLREFEEEIKKIDDMVGDGVYDGTVEARRKALVTCCEKWYVRKELHWKQMSRSRHVRDIDKNTRYFHNIASARRRNNRVDALVINGRLIRNQARIKIAIREFYKDLYHQEELPLVGFRDGLVEMISEDDALTLETQPTSEEVREAVWDCESSKAPRSDGYNMNFIKKCWDEIGSEFTGAVLGFFQSSKLPANANLTWIHDGDLIACETVQWIKLRKKEAVIIKLDFQKAYDRVKWSFVDLVLQKMGFGRKWRGWVMECVSTCSMSILINGSPSKPFKMERDLRQGDPLSPFLFVLVVDVLHRMLGEAVRNGRISLLLVGRDHIKLSHLQFVDDTILFCPPEEETVKNYRRILCCFELMSGLSINFDKSSLIPINCDNQWVQRMCCVLGCKEASIPVKYLGISLGANPRLVKTWKPIIDKVEEKLSLWKAKVLNKAGFTYPGRPLEGYMPDTVQESAGETEDDHWIGYGGTTGGRNSRGYNKLQLYKDNLERSGVPGYHLLGGHCHARRR
nr:uncharacterized protein LOC112742257 [Arachis hypogaea]